MKREVVYDTVTKAVKLKTTDVVGNYKEEPFDAKHIEKRHRRYSIGLEKVNMRLNPLQKEKAEIENEMKSLQDLLAQAEKIKKE